MQFDLSVIDSCSQVDEGKFAGSTVYFLWTIWSC